MLLLVGHGVREEAPDLGLRIGEAERGVLEVETPALSHSGVTDPALESVRAQAKSLGSNPLFLQTSPEFAMKRLLATGSGDIYQICRVFRDDELGRWHQPEFTLLEFYAAYSDMHDMMLAVEGLFKTLLLRPLTLALLRRLL